MKHSLFAGILGGLLICCGCQTMNPAAKTQASVAQPERIREVPWSWGRRKTPAAATEMPPELAKKFEDARRQSDGNRTVERCIADGSDQERARDFAAARKAYEEALALDPVNATAHHRLAILADMRQEFGTARDHYDAALRQRPNDANILSDLGYSNFLQKNFTQSQMFLLKALDIDRQHEQALKNLGTLYAAQGRYEDAALAFRHYRSETEAEAWLAKYFPKGKPGSSDIALAGGARTGRPMPPEAPADGDLKHLSSDQVLALMDQEKQRAVRDRELKQLAELRPSLQPSVTAEDDEAAVGNPTDSPNPRSLDATKKSPWDETASTSSPATNDDVPDWSEAEADGMNGDASLAQAEAAPSRTAASEMPFWNGAGARSPENVQPSNIENWPSPADQSGAGGALSGSSFPPRRTNVPPSTPKAGGWDEEQVNQASARNVLSNPPETWPHRQSATNSQPSATSSTLNQQAYQLGMSVGPGTMFPVVSDAGAEPDAMTSPWMTNSSGRGYVEMKPAAPRTDAADSEPIQWQDAPTDISPRSPTEGWESPTSVTWPGSSASPPRGGTTAKSKNDALPLIQPAYFPGEDSAAAGSRTSRNAAAGNRNAGYQTREPADSNQLPEWFDAPTGN